MTQESDRGPRCGRWRPYFAHGRKQVRLGVWRKRFDRWSPDYRYIALEWQL